MKRNDALILVSTLAYSILFYKQLAGINFLIFTVIINAMLAFKKPGLLKNKSWLLFAFSTLFTGLCVVWNGTTLALVANITSLVLLSAYSISPQSSVILNLFYSLYSISGSVIFMILRVIDPAFREPKEIPIAVGANRNSESGFTAKKFLTFFIPVLLILVFFFIFRQANPIFKTYTDKINLDFISFAWIVFTLFGFVLMSGFFYHYRIKALDKWELEKPKRLEFYPNQKMLSFLNEKTAAIFLFSMLNLMLLFINGTDVVYLYLGGGMPEGITHVDFVHNGVGMLILSIIISISLMLFFFRGNMNFDEKAKPVKLLVYFWIIQNIMMIISTMMRNNIYVEEYLLTYKKLGVYIYLLLALVGMVTTFWKIYDKRNNWYLFRSNSMAGFLLLCIASAIDFDLLLTRYNISHAKNIAVLDKTYLLSLSESNLPELYTINNKPGFETNHSYHYSRFFRLSEQDDYYNQDNKSQLDSKLVTFLETNYEYGWRSWNRRRQRIMDEMIKLNEEGKLNELDLSGKSIKNLRALAPLKNMKILKMNNSFYAKWTDLEVFPVLEKLEVQNCGLRNLDSFPEIPNLKDLNISGNAVNSYAKLSDFKNLEVLHADNMTGSTPDNIPPHEKLKELHLRFSTLKKTESLTKYPALEKLDLYGSNLQKALPSLKKLRSLNLSKCQISGEDTAFFSLGNFPLLEELLLAENNLTSIGFLYTKNDESDWTTLTPKLKVLDLSGNKLNYTEKIYLFRQLQDLNISNCNLYYCPDLKGMQYLKKINLSGNYIASFAGVSTLNGLEELNLSANSVLLDFGQLSALTGLKSLNVSGTQFRDLNLLMPLTKLEKLNIQNTFTDLKEISKIPSLKTLLVTTITAKDLKYLKQLSGLNELYVKEINPEIKQMIEKEMRQVVLHAENISDNFSK